MKSFLLASLAGFAVQNANAHPFHSLQSLGKRAVDFNAFRMVLTTEYANATTIESDPSITALAKRADPQDTATELVKATVPGATFRLVGDHYVGDNGIAHFNFKQTIDDIDIDNADFNVNVSLILRYYHNNKQSVLARAKFLLFPNFSLKLLVFIPGFPVHF